MTHQQEGLDMSMTEAPFSLTVKVQQQLFTVRGDSWPEFESHLADAAASIDAVVNGINILLAAGEMAVAPQQAAPIVQPAYTPPQVQQTAPPPQQPQYVPQGGYPQAPLPQQQQPMGYQAAPPQQGATVLFGGQTQLVTDKWGKRWTYNMPGAPDLPDGRGKYAWLEAVSKDGKPYQCWADPSKGPERSFPAGVTEAARIWPDRR